VIIVGQVVNLGRELQWFKETMFGRKSASLQVW
jgi:hypothetical protein